MDSKLFLTAIFSMGCHCLFSQIPANYNADNESFGMQPMLQYAFQQMASRQLKDGDDRSIKGSRFLNRNFDIGTIYSKDGVEGQAYMRYDAYSDEVQLKIDDTDSTSLILNKDKNIYCLLSGKKMFFKSYFNKRNTVTEGYLFQIAETDSLVLFERRIKRYKDGKAATTSFELPVASRFVSERELYYEDKNDQTIRFLKTNKKAIVGLFEGSTSKASKIKGFINKNRLDLNDPKKVAQIFYYYNTL
ncbi:hypothetical protein FGF1_27490 [Flavobacteriaceae bacterium GF1]